MKYKLMVSKIFYKEVVVVADDHDHALEIASEVEEFMEANEENYFEGEWSAVQVSDDKVVTYEPVQEYLK